jgi:magnesium-transporting ATPase (P-type)
MLKQLYYQYYIFQKKVGNSDVAVFSPLLIISFITMVYYFGFLFIAMVFIPKEIFNLDIFFNKIWCFSLFISVTICLYLNLVKNEKYKIILKVQQNSNNKKNKIIAFLFPLIGFLLINIGWILKLLKNQGKL